MSSGSPASCAQNARCVDLHLQTQGMPLDFFVPFSSGVAVVGNPGHANYAAADAFLRRPGPLPPRPRLPALSINWGLLGQVGYVSRRQKIEEFLTRQGLLGLHAQATEILDRLLRTDAPQVVAFYWTGRNGPSSSRG